MKEKQQQILKGLREKVGLNRTEFANQMGIPLRTLEDWESGKRKMPDYVLRFLVYYAIGKFSLFDDKTMDFAELDKYNEIEDLNK